MRISQRLLVWSAGAFAVLFVWSSPAGAWWPFHRDGYTYRQRVVVRSRGAPLVVGGVPAGAVVGSRRVVGGEFFPEFFPLAEFAPLRETVLLRDSGSELADVVRREVARQRELSPASESAAEARRSSSGSAGTMAAGTPTGGTGSCAELAVRLDKIEGRLSDLSDKLKGISAGVDYLVEKNRQQDEAKKQDQFQSQIKQMISAEINQAQVDLMNRTAEGIKKRVKDNNQILDELFGEMLKAQKDDKVVEQLRSKLRSQ
jgi:hypothetical protein